ncbi:MAG: ABC-type dipeptide/oligopeptide/nickel transport system, permease component [Lachnoclostridium sp.]|jgi:peptide/nickel transport system permease protein
MKKGNVEFAVGLILILFVAGLAVVSLFYTPYDINKMDSSARNLPPSLYHLAGTDNFGRDIFSRLMAGARFTLLVAVTTVFGSAVIGSILGLISGYIGGAVDEVIMRIIDAINSFPGIMIALVTVTVLDYGKYTIILALCIMFIPSYTRIVRTGTYQYKEKEFVLNSRVFGASDFRLLVVHIFPNMFPLLLSSIVIGLSNAILAESSMSYLGLGIQPPAPSWGRMLSEAQSIIFKVPWYGIAPGLMIVITIAGFHCLGEGIRKKYCE